MKEQSVVPLCIVDLNWYPIYVYFHLQDSRTILENLFLKTWMFLPISISKSKHHSESAADSEQANFWWGFEYLGQIWLEKQCYLLELDPRKHPALSEYLKLEGRRWGGVGYK